MVTFDEISTRRRIFYLSVLVGLCAPMCLAVSIKQSLGGTYRTNATIHQRNGPYRVTHDLNVDAGVTLTIETGTDLYFDSGVGMRVRGTLLAVVCVQVHITPSLKRSGGQMVAHPNDGLSVDQQLRLRNASLPAGRRRRAFEPGSIDGQLL
jgi:hypothetical protein